VGLVPAAAYVQDDEGDEGGGVRLGIGDGGGMHGLLVAFASAAPDQTQLMLGDYEVNSMIAELLGNVQRGVPDTNAALVRVPDVAAAFTDVDKCPICYENLLDVAADGSTVVRTARCNHSFCDACIRTWLAQNATCPVCMTDLGAQFATTEDYPQACEESYEGGEGEDSDESYEGEDSDESYEGGEGEDDAVGMQDEYDDDKQLAGGECSSTRS
jgi:hypothetical protein